MRRPLATYHRIWTRKSIISATERTQGTVWGRNLLTAVPVVIIITKAAQLETLNGQISLLNSPNV